LVQKKRTIAVLWHERQQTAGLNYMIMHYASVWNADGHKVIFLFGTARFVPADLMIVHVDLSVVPDSYLELAARYPIALNARVRDIRKSSLSTVRVVLGDGWAGPVIVKSDLNCAGITERTFGSPRVPRGAWSERIRSPADYQVFETVAAVPAIAWEDAGVVIERFLPERDDGQYVTRTMVFVGDRVTCAKNYGPRPIVNNSSQTRVEWVEPHPDMLALRKKLGFDLGKFDYVMHEGKPILLDANKTVGGGGTPITPARAAARRHRARGLYAYFEGQA
jgi:hypothetical protein